MEISIILDFVCPYCYVGEKILEKALREKDLKPDFRFFPYELSPEPNPQPIVTEANKEYFEKNIATWAKEESIPINFPTISPKPRTALAFEGIYVAEKYNKGIEYVRAVLEAYWLHNKDIGNVEVLITIADNLLIPKFEFADDLLSGKFTKAHQKLNAVVSKLDFDVVPTFYINDTQLETFPRTTQKWLELLK